MRKNVDKVEKETYDIGLALGQKCQGGGVFMLCGDLGAGKTKLVQGLAFGLGIKVRVNSPTFNIFKLYKINQRLRPKRIIKRFCHIDAYRLKSAVDLETLGVGEFFSDPQTVVAIEWAEKVKKIWPRLAKIIKIKSLNETSRKVSIL